MLCHDERIDDYVGRGGKRFRFRTMADFSDEQRLDHLVDLVVDDADPTFGTLRGKMCEVAVKRIEVFNGRVRLHGPCVVLNGDASPVVGKGK